MVLIGTWNVENLFTPGGPSGPTTDAAYEAKIAGLAATLHDLDPDVLAVQEVGDPQALEDLAKKLSGHGYEHLATADPDGRGIRVGYLSRLPLLDVHQVATFPPPLRPIQVDDTTETEDAMGRSALVAGVVTPMGTRIDLVTCHLKSKLLTFPGGCVLHPRRGFARPLRRLRPLSPCRRGRHGPRHRDGAARRQGPGAGGDCARRPQRRA
jgi:hypothetical protein